MILSHSQIEELMQIADQYVATFVAKHIGGHVLLPKERALLKSLGFKIDSTLSVQQAFKFGMLTSSIKDAQAKSFSYAQLKNSLKKGTFLKPTPLQNRMIAVLEAQAAKDVHKMGAKMKNQIQQHLYTIEDNVIRHHEIVTEAAKKAVYEQKSLQQLASDIAEANGGWNKDFHKMADYVMHEAFNKGRAAGYKSQGESKVYFDVYPGACKHCSNLYLTSGVGSEPKIFSILELEANGSNVGRKANDWRATLAPTHPFCRCTVRKYMEAYEWNPLTRAFDKLKEAKPKAKYKSKIKVTVNGKTTEI